jgi:transposase
MSNQKATDSVPRFVGLDYHQASVQVCVLDANGDVRRNVRMPNDTQDVIRAVGAGGLQVQAAVEACCGAAALVDELTAQAGWHVVQAHPGFTSRMRQNPDKSDCSEAYLLADLRRVGYLPVVWTAWPALRDLRCLVRYRQQLVAAQRNVKLRIRALLREQRRKPTLIKLWGPSGRRWLQALELPTLARWVLDQHLADWEHQATRLRACEQRLALAVQDDAVVAKLLTLPGVGLVTAAVLRAEIGRFDRFTSGKALAHYCGLSPRNACSGQRQADAGLIKSGHPALRAILIQTAHRLCQRDPRWQPYKGALRARGKPGSVAAAAIANRWVRWLYYQMVILEQTAA